jgi:hypothetical protein
MCIINPKIVSKEVYMEKLLILVADYANLTGSNKLNVMGIFSELNPPSYPYRLPTMFLIVKLRAELGEFGQSKLLTIKFVDQDGNELMSVAQEMIVPDMIGGRRPELNAIMSFNNLEFPGPGSYQFVVMVDKDYKGEVGVQANETIQR